MRQGNFIYMLTGLLLLILLGPAISLSFPESSNIINDLAFITVMAAGVWSLNKNKLWFVTGLFLMVSGTVLVTVNIFTGSVILFSIYLLIILVFCILSVIIAIKYIIFSGSITVNKIVGSVCIYLLLGVIWGVLYILIDVITPGAFKGLSIDMDNRDTWNYIYYSFVTITSLGYGDITPVSQYARVLSFLEVICGQIYIAVLVASLVGAHLADRQSEKQ